MFARYGTIKSLRCVRDTTAKTTKRVQVTYEKAISVKLALRSELLRPLDLRKGEGVASSARKRQQQTLPKTRNYAYVSSHAPAPADAELRRSRSVEPWRVIPSEPIDNFAERHRSASVMEGVGHYGARVNSWLPPIVRNRVSTDSMEAVREGLAKDRLQPRVRIDPETKQMISRRDQGANELPDEMATMRDPSSGDYADQRPSKTRKMLKKAINTSCKERLRRYDECWSKSNKSAPKPIGNGPSMGDVAVQAMRKHAHKEKLQYHVLGEIQ